MTPPIVDDRREYGTTGRIPVDCGAHHCINAL